MIHPHHTASAVALVGGGSRVLQPGAIARASGGVLFVDEAYAPFLPATRPPRHASLIRVLSPGKAHGLVGARPAYALAAADVVARLDNLAPAWHVPAGTAAVLAALPQAMSKPTPTTDTLLS